MKVASCLGAILALGVASAGGAVQAAKVPGGFRVETYVRGLQKPTAMAWGPRGVLYLTQEGGEVVSIDPRTRRVRVVLRGFETPLGLAWLRGNLFVSAKGTLWRVSSGQRKAILRNLPFGRHQQDDVIVEKSRLSAAILSVSPDGSGLRILARGLRNPYGLAVDPATGRLYASVNERDDLGDREPAETIVELRDGRDFGWPRCWPSHRGKRLRG